MKSILVFSIFFFISNALAVDTMSVKEILDHFHLSAMSVSIKNDTVEFQKRKFKSNVSFEQSIRLAIHNILNDDRDIESPLSLMIEDSFFKLKKKISTPVPIIVKLEAQKQLKFFLNKPSTFLGLYDGRSNKPFCFPPEHGEKIRDYWIYCLKISEYSDHLYWILVSRLNKKNVYNYGFN